MIRLHKRLRLTLAAVFTLTAVTVSTFLTSPSSEAADCGGYAGGMSYEWIATTAAAQARNSANECGDGFECREWCLTSCGTDVQPLGEFECFPN